MQKQRAALAKGSPHFLRNAVGGGGFGFLVLTDVKSKNRPRRQKTERVSFYPNLYFLARRRVGKNAMSRRGREIREKQLKWKRLVFGFTPFKVKNRPKGRPPGEYVF